MVFYLHNTSRAVSKRAQRYAAASHKGLVQFLGERRIRRGRPLVLTEKELVEHEAVIRAGIESGYLELRTAEGAVLNPEKRVVKPAPPVAKETPQVVLDSVVNDLPSGNPMPIYPNGAVQSPGSDEVEVDPEDESDPLLEDEEDEEEDVEFSDAAPSPTAQAPSSSKSKGKRKKGR